MVFSPDFFATKALPTQPDLMNVLEHLRSAFAAATPEGGDATTFAKAVRPSQDAKFGEYQANGCLALGKLLGKNPRDLAADVNDKIQLAPLAGAPEIAGPGFLNVRLSDDWLADAIEGLLNDETLGISVPDRIKTVVIDYSSPNVAKPMHVGHVRSTVIGESLSRIFKALGHKVIRDNHLGDWGSQFGMILWGWKNHRDEEAYEEKPVAELARLYRLAQARIKAEDKAAAEDQVVKEATRAETAKLHAGDEENRKLWAKFMPECLEALGAVYERLGVKFDVELGESFYDPMLAGIVTEFEENGLAVESEGATVVFTPGFKAPFMVRKSDGAFNYATTDLATIRYRANTWNPDLCLYVVDHRQGDHFKQLFAIAKQWGYDQIEFNHVAFGTILGTDKKPFKTRDGDVVGLESLLDEGVAEARKVIDENSPELDQAEREKVAEVVGLGSIKYADLSQNRLSDYVFDWKKMLAMNGNTGAYLQYAYARIQRIFRRGEVFPEDVRAAKPTIVLSHPAERALAVCLVRLPEILELAAVEFKPNVLTDYLFELANRFSTLYVECPVLKAESEERRQSRLALSDVTARTLKFGLNLLGMDVVDRM